MITEEFFNKSSTMFPFEPTKKKTYGRELRIQRVKFKPGYQRLWRQFRLAFAESVNYRYIYQQQLTRYLMKFYRKVNTTYFSQNEHELHKVVIYSKLLPDFSTFNLFFL
jgi:hypothetical protein